MSEEAQAQPAIADLSGEANVEGVQKQEAAPQEPIPPLDPAQVAWQQQMQQYTEYWKSHQPSQGQAAPFYTGGGVSHPFGLWPAQSMMYGSPFYGHAGMAPYYPPSTMAPAAGQLAEAAEAVAALNPNGKHSFAPGGLSGGESKGAGGVVDEGNAQENGESLGKARLPVKIKQDPPAHVSLPEASIIGSGAAALAALAAAQVRSVVMPGAVASTELWHPHHSVVQATSEQRSVREDSPDSPAGYQDEREQKRQKRKQSNRESARRSRLRKQAECETLGSQVSDLKRQIAEQADRIVQLEKELAQYKGRS